MNTIAYLTSNAHLSVDVLRSSLYAAGICWCDSINGQFNEYDQFRVILYLDRSKADFSNPMVKECNGLVLEYFKNQGWNVLAVPPQAFNQNQISMKKLSDLVRSGVYNVYDVLDSTIINLYYYNNSWRISTIKGYDVTDLEMCKNYTYMDILKNITQIKYKEFSFDKLNQQCSYTLSLRYQPYHIFMETRSSHTLNTYITLHQVINRFTLKPSNEKIYGLYVNYPLKLKEHNLHTLLNSCKTAYSKYEKSLKLGNVKFKPLYGYILRTNNESVPEEYKNIYLESSLMKLIRNGIYKNNNENLRNLDYPKITISLFMNRSYSNKYEVTFNQFSEEFESLKVIIKGLSETIMSFIHKKNYTQHSNEIVSFVNLIINDMHANNIINNEHSNIPESVVYDYIYDYKYKKHLEQIITNSDLVRLIA